MTKFKRRRQRPVVADLLSLCGVSRGLLLVAATLLLLAAGAAISGLAVVLVGVHSHAEDDAHEARAGARADRPAKPPAARGAWSPPSDCPEHLASAASGARGGRNRAEAAKATGGASVASDGDFIVAMVAMGNVASNDTYAERSVQSLRRAGGYGGAVVLVTDAAAPGRYDDLALRFGPLVVLRVDADDYSSKVTKVEMKYKRYKTALLELLDERLDSQSTKMTPMIPVDYEYVIYMDVDIVAGDDLTGPGGFFDHVRRLSADRDRDRPPSPSTPGPPSFMMMFEDPGRAGKNRREAKTNDPNSAKKFVPFHTGVVALHRTRSPGCLDIWQRMFDSNLYARDQGMMAQLTYHSDEMRRLCEVVRMDGRYLHFPTKESMQMMGGGGDTASVGDEATAAAAVAAFVHTTRNSRGRRIPPRIQRDFFRCVVGVEEGALNNQIRDD